MSGAAEAPKPPEEPELRNIIDKLAQFVARNGPDFENMTKQKQKDNPRFSFLFGGDYFQYYMYKVNAEQAIMRKQKMQAEQTTSAQKQMLQQQLHESEKNLQLQYEALMQQQQVQIDDAIFLAERDKNRHFAEEYKINLDEFSSQLELILVTCSKEAITSNKNWFFSQCLTPNHAEIIFKYLINRIKDGAATFTFKLHVLYLLNDLIHHYMRKQNDAMLALLGNFVATMFSIVFVGNAGDETSREKLNKLRSIWETQNYFSSDLLQKLQNVQETYDEYRRTVHQNYSSIVDEVKQKIQAQYQQYEKQHLEYARHIQLQMAALEGRPSVSQGMMPMPFQAMPASQGYPQQQPQQTQPYQPPPSLLSGSNSTNGSAPLRKSRFDTGPPVPLAATSAMPSFAPPPSSGASSSAPTTPIQSLAASMMKQQQQMRPMNPAALMPPSQMSEGSGFSPSTGQSSPVVGQQPPRSTSWHQGSMPDFGNMGGSMPYGPRMTPPFPPQLQGMPGFPLARCEFPPGQHASTPPRAGPSNSTPLMNMSPRPLFPPGAPNSRFMGPPGSAGVGPGAQWNQPMPMGGPQASAWPPRANVPQQPPVSSAGAQRPQRLPSLLLEESGGLIPKVPYYDLPAALMVPLVELADHEYKPLDPSRIRLPPPMPPSERLLAAIEAFYSPPNHENPRDSDGWEKLGLYEYYKAKQNAIQRKERGTSEENRDDEENGQRDERNSRSGSYSSRGSRSRSRTKSRSRSRANSRSGSRSRTRSRSYSRSPEKKSKSRSRSRTP